ncbi:MULTISPECIES: ATP-binding protein [Acidobacterium]|uniref:sensor histidine kinase n=1 Tax=Acidobacterium TaxID=33973 RepID=UPI000A2F4B78|nr:MULTISPECIES: ATP-binding protein [Acidobacterium]
MNRTFAITGYRMLLAGVGLAVIVELCRLLAHSSPTTVALTLLLYILVLAARWGLRYAVVASIAAAACFNFFFLPPVGTFTIADTQNWVALFAFLGSAIVASHLSSRIQQEARQAKERERELGMLFELSRSLLQTDKVAELLEAIPECIASATGTPAVLLYVERGAQMFHTQDAAVADLQGLDVRAAVHLTEVRVAGSSGWTILPVRSGIRPRGVLVMRGISASRETLESLARLVSIGIDRAEALEDAARSEAAKESERLRMVLLDSITHELRTPLTAIKASATALLSGGNISPENRKDMLVVIDEESDRLNRLIAQATQMGQLEASSMRMEFAACRVEDLIADAVRSSTFSLAGHPLESSIAHDCPPVLADAIWIERAIANLLLNAAKYSPPGSPIQIVAARCDNHVSISITDDGPGIDPEEKEMLFERFYRGQRFRGRISGTGLGLAICRAVVTAHRGSIDVQNLAGRGARFTVTLPVS